MDKQADSNKKIDDSTIQIKHNFISTLSEQIKNNTHPISLTFQRIKYEVDIEDKTQQTKLPCLKKKIKKRLLEDVSGIFKGGQMTAIMGASGAGKTTLLNIIACRIEKTEGNLLANKQSYDYNSFGHFGNYVMQQDVLMQTLTVRQTLNFAANLKLNLSEEQKQEKISLLVKQMKLQKCLDVVVGGPILKGISGGEKKRTSIAFELISDPQVIALDEPTSGLDSLTSYIIVAHLARLAHQQKKTVIMTIHQPSSDIFAKFDKLFLMVEGRLVYQGSALKALDYFSSNFSLTCPQFLNPAEYYIAVLHHENQQNVKRYPKYFQTYDQKIQPKIIEQINHVEQTEILERQVKIPMSVSFGTLLKRDWVNAIRNPLIIKSRVFQTIFLSIYTGGLFFYHGRNDYTNQVNWAGIAGFFFFLCITSLMQALSPVSLIFPTQRLVFLKQENSRMYGVLSYFISRNIVELPYLILMALLFDLILYWMIQLSSTAQQFFIFYLITFLIGLAGNSLGLLLGSVITDAKSVAAATPLLLIPFVLFSGFFKNRDNLPVWIGWIEYISPLKYGFNAFMINQTSHKASLIGNLKFDLDLWGSIGILFALAIGFRFFSLFFLWLLRTRLQ